MRATVADPDFNSRWINKIDFEDLPTTHKEAILTSLFEYKGFSCFGAGLLSNGWIITIVENKVVMREKLYFRHPDLNLIARYSPGWNGIFSSYSNALKLDYLMNEKNQRIKHKPIAEIVPQGEFKDALEVINRLQKQELKPKPKVKKTLPEADIIELIKRRA